MHSSQALTISCAPDDFEERCLSTKIQGGGKAALVQSATMLWALCPKKSKGLLVDSTKGQVLAD